MLVQHDNICRTLHFSNLSKSFHSARPNILVCQKKGKKRTTYPRTLLVPPLPTPPQKKNKKNTHKTYQKQQTAEKAKSSSVEFFFIFFCFLLTTYQIVICMASTAGRGQGEVSKVTTNSTQQWKTQAFQGTGWAALSLDHAGFLMAPKAKPGQLCSPTGSCYAVNPTSAADTTGSTPSTAVPHGLPVEKWSPRGHQWGQGLTWELAQCLPRPLGLEIPSWDPAAFPACPDHRGSVTQAPLWVQRMPSCELFSSLRDRFPESAVRSQVVKMIFISASSYHRMQEVKVKDFLLLSSLSKQTGSQSLPFSQMFGQITRGCLNSAHPCQAYF